MKTITFILLISTLIYGHTLQFTQSDIAKIKADPNKSAIIKRIQNYEELGKKIKDFSTIRKLGHINSFYNSILPELDKQKYGISDYWSTRKEFLIAGRGDCEDYTIAKYFSLLENGFLKDNLFLAVVQVKGKATKHMVLLYFPTRDKIPYVLDNLSFRVIPLNKRPSLEVDFIFNEKESYLMKNDKISKKVRINWGKEDKWNNLLKRVYVNKE
ncbi:MAG: transglutaminase-like cysteine peptidase [Arcobacter sp.]|uniref:transglutaminase-like cysteine peptidase n=1 Tax=Arcobacter sp. TaxID=1872629 RepID=UPI003C7950DF